MMVDTHCHLEGKYYSNLNDVIKKMESNIIIVSGTDLKSNEEVLVLCEKYNNIYGTIGFHPTELESKKETMIDYLIKNINNPKVVGIGEIGLDYHYGKENKDFQQEMFAEQIKIANEYHKTIVIHSRDAAKDTYDIIKKHLKTKAIMHCYSYSLEMARDLIEFGLVLGIGGILTFKNSIKLKEIVKNLSLDNLVLETDSPFLTPEPFRGEKNEPYNIYYVAKEISKIKGIPLDDVLKVTTRVSLSQFDIKL